MQDDVTDLEDQNTQEDFVDLNADDESLETPAQTLSPDDELPEKYRGKSVAEIARMHAELEKAYGRQGAEFGELRKVADSYLRAGFESKTPKEPKTEDDDAEFFTNPKAAIAKAVEGHPAVVEARQRAEQAKRDQAQRALAEKHPDGAQIIADPRFREWVSASPVRKQLMVQADRGFDVAAADELFTTFKALHPAQTPADDNVKVGKVATGSGGSSGSGKKVYRRADLIKLQQTDPKKYERMSDEIMRAYQEGRVR